MKRSIFTFILLAILFQSIVFVQIACMFNFVKNFDSRDFFKDKTFFEFLTFISGYNTQNTVKPLVVS